MPILYIFYYEKCAQDRIWDYAYFEFFLHIFENSEISFVLTSFMHYEVVIIVLFLTYLFAKIFFQN